MTLRVTLMVAGLIVCLPLHYLWEFAGRTSPWPRLFLGWVGYAAGLRVRIVGQPLRTHVLFVSNHLSWLDIMLLAKASGATFVSKDEVARWPIIGWLAGLNRTIFVARAQKGAVRDQADTLRTALAAGQPVALFPEGTTEGGVDILPFRASLLASLFPPIPGVMVQPVALNYGEAAHDIAWVGKEAAGANAKRVLSRKGTIPVTIAFLEPVDPRAFPGRKDLTQQVQKEIVVALSPSEARGNGL